METTSREIEQWAKAEVIALAASPDYSGAAEVRDVVSKLSGVSAGRIRQWVEGRGDNLTIETLDSILAAVKKLRKAA